MQRESRVSDLKDLDFLALTVGLGLLVLLFRQIERWLHQHIFKVGWLLTNDFQITTVLYYIVFLPGILLHELTVWLAAAILKVRAESAPRFPEEHDISELRLGFIRLAPDTSYFKQILISLSPLASGLVALWAISVALFPGNQPMTPALPNNVADLGDAITSYTHTANFWLWLYIVFTIANRCFPSLPVALSSRQKYLLMLALPALSFGLWRASDQANPAIALGIEGLLSGLTLIIAQITLLNSGCVLVLGALEALIERISSRSATFRDGRIITFCGSETAPAPARQSRERENTAKDSAARQAAPATSIYDLKLPIPGPPGREPVSRQAVAVVNLNTDADASNQGIAARPKPSPAADSEDESPRQNLNLMSADAVGLARIAATDHDPSAPFARPFTQRESPRSTAGHRENAPDESGSEPFARPFVMRTRSDQPATAGESFDSEADTADTGETNVATVNTKIDSETERDKPRRRSSRTRPAPKPSQKAERQPRSAETLGPDELKYEDLDEADDFDYGDDTYDGEL